MKGSRVTVLCTGTGCGGSKATSVTVRGTSVSLLTLRAIKGKLLATNSLIKETIAASGYTSRPLYYVTK